MIEAPRQGASEFRGGDGIAGRACVHAPSRRARPGRGARDLTLEVRGRRDRRGRRPERLRQDDAARADLRPAAPDPGSSSAPAALMPQRDLLLPWLSAIDNAGLALRVKGITRAQARAQAAPWFERFGLAGFERASPAELSGGMRQRVSFLRSLLAGKPVLALDEPFAALDAITRAEMQGWLAHVLRPRPRTVVLVTHDVEEAVLLGDRVVVMSARPGRVVADIAVVARPRRAHGPTRRSSRCAQRALQALGVPA